MKRDSMPGATAVASKGWLRAHKWLILRRLSQLGVLGIFLIGPLAGIWIVKGNLASSLTLDVLPLTDPYVLLQSFFAGTAITATAMTGAAIVLVFYLIVGGRAYCAWVCPMNMVTDTARWLRHVLKIKGAGSHPDRKMRYWFLAMTLVLALLTGTLAWELINPVSMLFRGLVFGMGMGWAVVAGIFFYDLFISRDGWCGHVCPVGAFYSLVGEKSLIRVSAARREQCDDCMDCFAVCPEQQVIRPALKGASRNIGPVIMSANCTNCGRCIDVCDKNVFRFSTRFNNSVNNTGHLSHNKEVTS